MTRRNSCASMPRFAGRRRPSGRTPLLRTPNWLRLVSLSGSTTSPATRKLPTICARQSSILAVTWRGWMSVRNATNGVVPTCKRPFTRSCPARKNDLGVTTFRSVDLFAACHNIYEIKFLGRKWLIAVLLIAVCVHDRLARTSVKNQSAKRFQITVDSCEK